MKVQLKLTPSEEMSVSHIGLLSLVTVRIGQGSPAAVALSSHCSVLKGQIHLMLVSVQSNGVLH